MGTLTKINHLSEICIEIVRRIFNGRSNIFVFYRKKKKILFYCPNWLDYIQQKIISRRAFYEEEYLDGISRLIPKNSNIIDIGSNIGNHAIYFCKILDSRVYCFEPHPQILSILKKNIEINGLNKSTKIYNFALGKENSHADIFLGGKTHSWKSFYEKNIGATEIRENKQGIIKLVKLDSVKLPKNISLIKIDVEGFEKEVLLGAKKTINASKPLIFIETFGKNKDFVFRFLRKRGYVCIKEFDGGNYLFKNKKNSTINKRVISNSENQV